MKFLHKILNLFKKKNKVLKKYPNYGYNVESNDVSTYVVVVDQEKYTTHTKKLKKRFSL